MILRKEIKVRRRRNVCGLWFDYRTIRFFAESPAAPSADGGGSTATPAQPTGGAAADAPSFLSQVCDDNGILKDGWSSHFKDQIGDSKYFDVNFKPGKDGVRELVQHIKELSGFKGRPMIPKADAPDEEWNKVWEAAGGIPKTPDGYGLTLEDNPNNPFPAGFKEMVEKSGFMEKIAKEMAAAKIPMRLASAYANARIGPALERYNAANESRTKAHKEILEPVLGKTTVEEASQNARSALATLCGHTKDAPSPVFQSFIDLMTDSGMMEHPVVLAMMHQIATRMNPGKAIVRGTTVTMPSSRNTGPGVAPQVDYASAMCPVTLQQVTNRR